MRIRQLGSSIDSNDTCQHLTTFLINDQVAIDAGCLGLLSPMTAQKSIEHVFLSHSHIDHIASLPLFLENVFQPGYDCPRVFASDDVQRSLTNHLFNDQQWPNLSRLGSDETRFFEWREMVSEVAVQTNGLTITPVSVDHVVPTFGFLIEDENSAVVISSDTGPTERIWQLANQTRFRRKLRLVFLECSFPDDHQWLARESKHLCTSLFARERAKISSGPSFTTVAVHLKATMHDRICSELKSLYVPDLVIGGHDQTWM